MRANYNKAPTGRPTLKLQCRYTKQLTRKKKTWQDGIIKIIPTGNTFIAQLFDADDLRDQSLESRQMTPKEADHFRRKALQEMTFSNHMVEFNLESEPAPYVAPVKVTKFKPPSVVSRPPPPEQSGEEDPFAQYYQSSSSTHHNIGTNQNRGMNRNYNPRSNPPNNGDGDDDVDELWGAQNSGTSGSGHQSTSNNRRENSSDANYYNNSVANNFSNNSGRRYEQDTDTENEYVQNVARNTNTKDGHYTSEDRPKHYHNSFSTHQEDGVDSQPEKSHKRPHSEVSGTDVVQQSQRQKQETTVNPHIRGSMTRVDQSIWDD